MYLHFRYANEAANAYISCGMKQNAKANVFNNCISEVWVKTIGENKDNVFKLK